MQPQYPEDSQNTVQQVPDPAAADGYFSSLEGSNSAAETTGSLLAPAPLEPAPLPTPKVSNFRRNVLLLLVCALVIVVVMGLAWVFSRNNKGGQQKNVQNIPVQTVQTSQQPLSAASGLLQVQNGQGKLIVNGDIVTQGSYFLVSNSGATGQIQSNKLTQNRQISLPDASGTICLDTNNCGFLKPGDIQIATPVVPTLNGQGGDITIQGTPNQILVSQVGSTLTLRTPQDLADTSSPAFASLSLGTALSLANGGTGATTAGGARINLGAAASGANNDITSTSALNTITPSAAMTIGATNQSLTLQGNGSTVLTANQSGFVTSVGFVGVPTGNVNYRFDSSATPGNYTICTTAGNCVGGGGGVTSPGGTPGAIAKFTGAQTLGDSLLSEAGTTVTVAGTLAATTLQGDGSAVTSINASNISSGTLADARLSTNVTLAGNVFNGASQLVQTTAGGALPVLSGANLTTLNGSNISSGTVNDARLSANVTLAGNTFNGASQLVQTTAGGELPALSGANVTNLNGSNVSTGTIADARLSNNVALLNGSQTFTNTNSFTAAGTALTVTNTASFGTVQTNNISPTAALTIGSTSQMFALQGNASSTITATGGGFVTTLGFAGVPTGNVVYNFDRNAAAGTYSVCTTAGNCVGSGGGVTTSGGTNGAIAKFTGSQTLADSLLSESGTVITVAGDMAVQGSNGVTVGVASSVNGRITFANATNANTITLQSGATGSNLVFTLPTADGASGDCLKTNASGVLSFGACLSGSGAGGGVSSLNTLTGALTVQGTANQVNVSNGGSTITISTPQDINTSSAPSFAGLTVTGASGITIGTNTVAGSLAFQDGSSAFAATFQPATLSANRSITIPNAGGTLAVSASGNIALSANGDISFTGQLPIANGGTNANNAASARSNLGAAASGANGDITSTTALNTITPSAALLMGATGQQFTLQGDASSIITATGGGFTTTVGFTGSPTGNVRFDFDRALAAGTYTICVQGSTNCGFAPSTGSGSYIQNGTAIQTANFAIQSAASGSIGGVIRAAGSQTADLLQFQSSTPTVLAGVSATGSIYTGGRVTVGANSVNTGGALFVRSVAAANSAVTIEGASSQSVSLTRWQTNGGAVLLEISPTGEIHTPNTTNNPSLNLVLHSGDVSGGIGNSGNVNIDAGAITGGGSGVSGGVNIGTVNANSVAIGRSGVTTAIAGTLQTNTIMPTAAFTVGATGQAFTLQGNASSTITATGGGFATTVGFSGVPSGAVTYNFDRSVAAGTYTICTSAGNCLGGGGGGANTALSNLSGVAINTSLLTGAATIDLGSNSNPFRDLYLGGTATNNFRFTGTASGARTITIPDATGTLTLNPTTGSYLVQVPTSTAANTITPTTNGVVALTVNGTSGTAATAMDIVQSGAATGLALTSGSTGDGQAINLTNTSGTQTNGLVITRNGVGGTTTNLLNLSNTAGTVANAINLSGTYTNLLTAANFTLANDGSITTNGGYTQSGTDANTFTGNTAVGNSATPGSAVALRVSHSFGAGASCVLGCIASENRSIITGAASNTFFGMGVSGRVETGASAFTLGMAAGLYAGNLTLGAGSAVTDNYGLFVEPMTGGAANYGAAIGSASDAALWLGNDVDSTAVSGGILFGLSQDTNLYRSAPATLRTDTALSVGTTITAGTGLTVTSGGATVTGNIVANTLGSADSATYLCRNSSNQLATCNTTGNGAAFVQGGNNFGATAVIGTQDVNNVNIITGNTTRLAIDTSGNSVYTGTLAVNNASNGVAAAYDTTGVTGNGMSIDVQSSATTEWVLRATSGNNTVNGLFVRADGFVGMGTLSPTSTYKLEVVGAGYFSGKPTANSDNGALTLGASGAQSANDINGVIGFYGTGVGHGQIAYSVGDGFYLCTATNAPAGDYGQCATRMNLHGAWGNFNGGVTGTGGAISLTGNTASLLTTSAGNLRVDSAAVLNIGTGGTASTIQVGNTTGAVAQTINIGNNSTASSTNNINIGSSVAGTTAITGATTVTGRISGSATTLTVNNSTSTGNILLLQDAGSDVLTVADDGFISSVTTATDTVNSSYGISSAVTYNPGSAAGSLAAVGIQGLATSSASAANLGSSIIEGGEFSAWYTGTDTAAGITVKGMDMSAWNTNTGTITSATGAMMGVANLNAAGIITTATGMYINGVTNAGTITNNYGLRVSNSTGGTITNNYGLVVENQTGGSTSRANLVLGSTPSSGNWSIYNASTNNNVFGGSLTLGGTTAPATALMFEQGSNRAISVGTRSGSGAGYGLTLQAGTAGGGNSNGGDLTLSGGANTGSGVAGAVIVKAQSGSNNTTTAFQVQNAAGTSKFLTVDASNTRVYVSDSADTAGTILVLGNKTSAGDPTGVDGAMYYSVASGAFRCYTDEGWGFCGGISRASQGYRLYEDFFTEDTNNGSMGTHSWNTRLVGGGAATPAEIAKATTDASARPGVVYAQTGSNANGSAAIFLSPDGLAPNMDWIIGGGEVVETAVQIPVLADGTNPYTIRVGLCDNDVGDCTDGIYFEYSNANANWQYATASNGARTKVASSTAASAGSWVRLKFVVNSAANSVQFYVNGVSAGSPITTTIPTGSARATGPMIHIVKGGGATSRDFHIDYYESRNSFSTLR